MKKRVSLGLVAAALAVGMFPGTASAGLWCEQVDDVGAGGACRAVLGTALDACTKVASKWGNECQLG